MAHRIEAKPGCPFVVVDDAGTALSWHRSEATAQKAIEREAAGFRRRYPRNHYSNNVLPRCIVDLGDLRSAYIDRITPHSTSWGIA